MKKCAIISTNGLGDGLIALVMSNNMYLNGWQVDTYHDGNLDQLQNWFFHLPIKPYPNESLSDFFNKYDKIFVYYSEAISFIKDVIKFGKDKRKKDTIVLSPSFSRNYGQQAFYEDAYFLPNLPYADNIKLFCERILHLKTTTKENGMKNPYQLTHRKNACKVIFHPEAAKNGRKWGKERYVKLAINLMKDGYTSAFIVSPKERYYYEDIERYGIELRSFDSFDKLASFIYECGYMVGNDSGIGHLASSLGLATLTLSRSKRTTDLWRPAWGSNIVLYPSYWVPNIKIFRLRDKHWQKFISVKKVKGNFKKLIKKNSML